ncbi:MAG: acyl-CoA/acyl-ACP dehydrogenase [Actinobacteria bacterium]|nr:acyl-CoA/acyl-ACP dehydrogenase [Actinomycetota bacterium]
MNFTFSEEQVMLRDSARDFLAARYPIEKVAEIADGDGFDPADWPAVAELGWTGISVPEDAGGAGMGFLEEMVVIEELGRALYPGPFFSTVVLALPALQRSPELLERVLTGEAPATLAWAGPGGEFTSDRVSVGAGFGDEDDSGHLFGMTLFVPDLAQASLVVVPAMVDGGMALWAVEADAEKSDRAPLPTVDTTRRLGSFSLEGAEARLLAGPDEAGMLLESIRDRALAALAAEAVGVASRALELSVEHASTREQFGKPIGAFQMVSAELADAYVEVEQARSLAYWAAWAVAHGSPDAPVAAAGAKAYAAEAAVRTCERAIQVHGGIGFTWEHPLHRYYKRALWIAAYLGWPADQRERVAASLLD